jgi:hypothetical protein
MHLDTHVSQFDLPPSTLFDSYLLCSILRMKIAITPANIDKAPKKFNSST